MNKVIVYCTGLETEEELNNKATKILDKIFSDERTKECVFESEHNK